MDEKVEPQTESRDMTERVEEMLSAIDAASAELDRQGGEGESALIDDLVEMGGALKESADDTAALAASAKHIAEVESPNAPSGDESQKATPGYDEAEALADADAGFVLDDLMEPAESVASDQLEPTGQEVSLEGLLEDLAAELDAEADAPTSLQAVAEVVEELAAGQADVQEPAEEPAGESEPEAALGEFVATSPETEDEEVATEVAAEADQSVERESPDPAQSIEQLDAELASLADAMLEGSFEDVSGDETDTGDVAVSLKRAPSAEAPPGGAAVAPPPSLEVEASHATTNSLEVTAEVDVPAADDSDEAGVPVAGNGLKRQSGASNATKTLAAACVDAKPSASRAAALLALLARAARFLEPSAQQAWAAARPTVARVVLLASKPIEKLSPGKRDTIGWFAVYTAFLAVCVWGFVLLFRKPTSPQPTTDPINILGDQPTGGDELSS